MLDKFYIGFHKDLLLVLFYFFFEINDLSLSVDTDLYANDTTLYDIDNSVDSAILNREL